MRVLNAVIAHKDFEWNDLSKDELKNYIVFTYNDIKTNLPNVTKLERPHGLDDSFYGEMSILKYIRHNVTDFDWITINHYRRRLEVPDYTNIYVPSPISFGLNVKQMYSVNHCEDDINLITDIIMDSNLSPNYKSVWVNSLSENDIFCYNMCSVPKEMFCDLIDTFEKIVDKFIEVRKFKTYEDVVSYCDKVANVNNNHMPYRIGGFISERLTNSFFKLQIKNYNYINCINIDKIGNIYILKGRTMNVKYNFKIT